MEQERLPDDAVVVRGGRSSPANIELSLQRLPEGRCALAVVCAHGQPLEELCRLIPHCVVRCTTVGAVRKKGGEVIRASGRSPYHALIINVHHASGYRATEVADLFQTYDTLSRTDNVKNLRDSKLAIFVDFNNADAFGRVRLNTLGSQDDIEARSIELSDGLKVKLYDNDEIVTDGVVRRDAIEDWVAEVTWSNIV